MGSKLLFGSAAAVALAVTFSITHVKADAVADYFKGRVGIMAVGFGPGGGYDRYSRLVVNHFGKHMPGKPIYVPQFMLGGGSLKMANYTYNVSPKDGSFIGLASPMLPIFQLIRSKGFKVDVRKLSWIGRLATQKHVMMVRSDTGIKNIDDWIDGWVSDYEEIGDILEWHNAIFNLISLTKSDAIKEVQEYLNQYRKQKYNSTKLLHNQITALNKNIIIIMGVIERIYKSNPSRNSPPIYLTEEQTIEMFFEIYDEKDGAKLKLKSDDDNFPMI